MGFVSCRHNCESRSQHLPVSCRAVILHSLQILKVDVQSPVDALLLDSFSERSQSAACLLFKICIFEDENDLEHDTVFLDLVHPEDIAPFSCAVLEQDGRETLENCV